MAKILIGFMGSGKSTVASLLDPNFVDMDAVITERIGMSIADFFASHGEAKFREIESQVLEELADSNQVIATGGGVVVNPHNRVILAKNPETIYLKADFETLYQRIQNDEANVRPLFVNNDKASFKAIFDSRQDFYEESANIIIDVNQKSPEEIIGLIK
ncbi:shikimate kinase [Streptococcus caballi]|uniref:shikimate kinase n=1 Tax=Streptococcus caballi TaxID=439220 RepID=UPI00036CC680|nr:shikimate kinase [Streptococcus caballi]